MEGLGLTMRRKCPAPALMERVGRADGKGRFVALLPIMESNKTMLPDSTAREYKKLLL